MRTDDRNGRNARLAILAAAVTTLAGTVSVQAQGVEYDISTAGATALGAFTRMNNNSGTGAAAPTAATINRGPLAVGTSFQLGNTAYSVPASGVAYYGQGILNGPVAGEPGNASDRARYYYLESGSVEGILTLVDSQGLRSSTPGQVFLPQNPGANLGLWINGNRYNAPNSTGAFNSGRSIGDNSINPATGQPATRIAWSDVRFEQAFAVNGTASFSRAPTTAGYGLGNGKIGNTNFQELRNAASIVGGTDPSTTRLRNESLAVVPFNLVANPGTGLSRVTKEEGGWLQAVGRLPNGADFNSVTRFVGSGTRNQGALNLGVDPSFGGGERDRRALGSYTSVTVDGTTGATVNVQIGDEADPLLSLTGSTNQDRNENRVGPSVRFSDKISGSSGVRATVVASRMGVGILSSGDSRSSDGNALASAANSGAPMRALAINFNNGFGYTQGTAENVTEGRYEMWSASQAITVSPTANPVSTDTAAPGGRPIQGDTDDDGSGVGVHRKFLDNITRSVATGNLNANAVTPFDFIVSASFIPTQIMGVDKQFDGGVLSTRTRSTVDPDGAGPLQSEQALWNGLVAGAGSGAVLKNNTAWADPSTFNGGLAINAVTYKIHASANNGSTATPNRTIVISERTNLAGDMNGDGVRDFADSRALAMAYAAPSAYLATTTVGARAYNGTAVNSTSSGTNASAADGLIVLTDFNSNGNVTIDSNDASFATQLVERADVRYFLYGAAVDTSSYFNPDTGTTINSPTAQQRREDGVRFGQMKKNAAIDAFNDELRQLRLEGVISTSIENALKFDKVDVNGDDVANIYDAKLVWLAQGKNVTILEDQLSFTVTGTKLINSPVVVNGTQYATTQMVSLIAPELNDDGVINQTDLDIALARVRGDTNLDGAFNNLDIAGFVQILTSPTTFAANLADIETSDLWLIGDFNGDGAVNNLDIAPFVAGLTGGRPVSDDPSFAPLASLVPEPGMIGLVALALPMLARRRRAR